MGVSLHSPSWDTLYETAEPQLGYFSTAQAKSCGLSPELLIHHCKVGRISRVRRGIYRLIQFPESENEELVVAWLWTKQSGVLSHETALSLHQLSDVLPIQIHITLPNMWKTKRLRVPSEIILYFSDIPTDSRDWHGSVPMTNPATTIIDCIHSHSSPELIEQAIEQAFSRGLISRRNLSSIRKLFSKAMATS